MIQFEDYDRITDILMYLGDSITLNFTVALSRKDKAGGRSFFHYETQYSSKYIGTTNARSIKRLMNFYFTLDNKNDFGNGFILRPQDVYVFLNLIENQLFPLFFDSQKRIFKVKEDMLVITKQFNPVMYTQSEYKFISITPIVLSYEDGYKEGVRMNINREYVDIDIDKFIGFYYMLKNTDMYSVACNMVTYTKTPPHGVNVYSRQGLGGGAPLPDEQWQQNDLETNDKRNNGNNKFLDNIKEKR